MEAQGRAFFPRFTEASQDGCAPRGQGLAVFPGLGTSSARQAVLRMCLHPVG